jgi:hypothetical protein
MFLKIVGAMMAGVSVIRVSVGKRIQMKMGGEKEGRMAGLKRQAGKRWMVRRGEGSG